MVELPRANRALASFEAWLATGGRTREDEMLQDIEGYNRDDVLSTLELGDWLELLRSDHERHSGETIPRPAAESQEPSESLAKVQHEIAELMASLTHDVPLDLNARSPEEQARWLMAHLLEFHRREQKSSWWEFFRRIGLTAEELIEDNVTLGGLEYVGVVSAEKRSLIHRYSFPPQEHDLKAGEPAIDPATGKGVGKIHAFDDAARLVDQKRGKSSTAPHPTALIPDDIVEDVVMRESLQRVGSESW